jgi:hypothetical protein
VLAARARSLTLEANTLEANTLEANTLEAKTVEANVETYMVQSVHLSWLGLVDFAGGPAPLRDPPIEACEITVATLRLSTQTAIPRQPADDRGAAHAKTRPRNSRMSCQER